jgi:hypothetical protein
VLIGSRRGGHPDRHLGLAALALLLASLGCRSDGGARGVESATPASTVAPAATASTSPSASAVGAPTADGPIGTATMEPDGTIVLMLRAEGSGAVGDALLKYPRGHKQYDEILQHLGGLRPGDTKPVPPFPE